MGKVALTKLWGLWRRAEIKIEHTVGQIIQHLLDHDNELKTLRQDVRRLKRQVAELSQAAKLSEKG